MSKIGDLIVRLQLKYQDYQKGLKKAEKDTKGFAATLGKIKGVGLAVWGAVGAGAVAMAKKFIQHSQTMSDKWNVGVNQMKAVWDQFLTSLTTWNWEGFGQRIKDAMDAAVESTAAHDAEFEVSNSNKLRKSAMAEELAQLQILMRDTRKSYEERAQAAADYLKKIEPIYKAEEELRKRIYLTDTAEYLKNAGLQVTADNRDLLRTFLTDIAPNESLVRILQEYQKKVQGSKKYELSAQDYKALDAFYAQYGNKGGAALAVLAQYYQGTNDDAANKVVDAIVNYDNSIALFAEETRKVQNLQNSALAQISKQTETNVENKVQEIERIGNSLEKLNGITGKAVMMAKVPDIIPDDWLTRNREKIDAAVAEAMRLQSITNEINRQFNDAVVDSLSGATQAFTECVMGIEGADASDVLAALMKPFAQTMISLGTMLIAAGTGIEAFKKAFESLNPYVAIAAGVGLVALGSALSAGIKSLAGSGSGSTATTSQGASSSTPSQGYETYNQEITVNVVGEISGDKIVLAGQKTLNKWNR